jgi:hypothetical protein
MTKQQIDQQIAEAQLAVAEAEHAVIETRALLQKQATDLKAARGVMAKALIAFQAAFEPITFDRLVRETIQTGQQLKRAIAEGRVAPPRHAPIGNSVVDRSAAYSAGGDSSDFVRKQLRTGYRRGALPASAAGRVIAPRAAVGVKAAITTHK